MSRSGDNTMSVIRNLGYGAALAMLLATTTANAQDLSETQLVNTLGQVSNEGAPIDVALLVQEVTENVGQGVANLPNWSRLAGMPQLTVEINFENNSIAIEPSSYRAVGQIADALHHPILSKNKFLVVGHTNATGDPKHNLKLSDERANAIVEALSTTFAIPASHLVGIGVGSELPVDPADPKAPVNRRVQLINIGKAN
ncbi:MAG: OmpA family protein [Rhizobiaceae bacterium]|nr:OmpA family protein [Rhizobiaceae bacterium]